ncbi:MAG: hypothetical protein RIR69_556 [Actinomycetota bacterium]|jgi:DNA-binding FrmR family transcriptional regulator
MNEVERIIDQLRAISEDLTDLSMQILSDAIADGATSRPKEEKAVSQARRSVDKAISQLLSAQ